MKQIFEMLWTFIIVAMFSDRSLAVMYASKFIGVDYRWGGESPHGFDCSGLVQEILRAVGLDPKGDQNADALYRHYLSKIISDKKKAKAGCLVFWGGVNSGRKTHIAFMISPTHIIEAGGGGSRTLTALDAEKQKAFVRVRPVDHRGDDYVILDPFK